MNIVSGKSLKVASGNVERWAAPAAATLSHENHDQNLRVDSTKVFQMQIWMAVFAFLIHTSNGQTLTLLIKPILHAFNRAMQAFSLLAKGLNSIIGTMH